MEFRTNTCQRLTAIAALATAAVLSPLQGQALLWQQQATGTTPPARRYATMAYNPATQRCVLFGGSGTSGTILNDTWVWDGSSWTDFTPPTSPSPRFCSSFAYDPNSQRMILFGGWDTGNYYGDTWAWDGTSWTQLTPSNPPPPRCGMAFACDEQRQVLVGFGGKTATGTTRRTYEFDGNQWAERIPTGVWPPARMQARAVYNAQAGRVQVFGGVTTNQDIWEWNGAAWSDVTPTSVPAHRFRAAVAYDRHLDQVVMVGGWFPLYTFYDEVWLWSGQWTAQPVGVRPSAREASAFTYDEARQQFVLFGGAGPGGFFGDTWLASSQVASALPYGNACGPAGTIVSDRPVLGSTPEVRIVSPATQIAFLAVGSNSNAYQGQPLPIDLSGIGMTGCDLLTSADIGSPGMTPVPFGAVVLSVQIANDPALIGLELFLQGFVLAPGANPLQVVSTRAIAWQISNM